MTIYLAMGWFGLFEVIVLGRRYGFNFVKPLLIGGIAYSVGALIDQFLQFAIVIPRIIHPHELLHVAVLAMGARFGIGCSSGNSRPGRRRGNGRRRFPAKLH